VRTCRQRVCEVRSCQHERSRDRANEYREQGRREAGRRSGAILSNLLGATAAEPLQDEVPAVWVLLELLGLLLKQLVAIGHQPSVKIKTKWILRPASP
jgi:hypothetical protein